MLGRRTVLIVAVAAAGCSQSGGPGLPLACIAGKEPVASALQRAPGAVRLADGTALSDCVRRAESDAELQNLGAVLTQVAEDLEAKAPEAPRAALQLGYLVGAARRGAPGDSALQTELVRRLERSTAIDLPPAGARSLAEGLHAGEANG